MNPVLMIFGPIVLAGVLALFLKKDNTLIKYIALGLFGFMLLFSINLLTSLPESGYLDLGTMLAVDKWGFALSLQVDHLSVIMLILTSVLLILVTLSSWTVKASVGYFSLLILFQVLSLGSL